jgi:hypothetical protein
LIGLCGTTEVVPFQEQNRVLGGESLKRQLSQNLQDMSNFGNMDSMLYEISYSAYTGSAMDK